MFRIITKSEELTRKFYQLFLLDKDIERYVSNVSVDDATYTECWEPEHWKNRNHYSPEDRYKCEGRRTYVRFDIYGLKVWIEIDVAMNRCFLMYIRRGDADTFDDIAEASEVLFKHRSKNGLEIQSVLDKIIDTSFNDYITNNPFEEGK